MVKLLSKKVIIVFLLIAAGAAIALILLGCRGGCRLSVAKKSSVDATADNLPRVKVLNLSKDNQHQLYLVLSGVVEPQAKVQIVPLTSGQVIDIAVEVGQEVRSSELLARLDNPETATALSSAMTALNTAEENLLKAQSTTVNQVKQAEIAVSSSEINLALARKSLDNTAASIITDLNSQAQAVAAAKIGSEQAQLNVQTTITQIAQNEQAQLNDAQTMKNNQAVWLDNVHKTLSDFKDNSALQGGLSALNLQVKIDAQQAVGNCLQRLDDYLNKTAEQLTKENISSELSDLITILRASHDTVQIVLVALNLTVAGSQISTADLSGLQAQFNGLEAQATMNLQTAERTKNNWESAVVQNANALSQVKTLSQQAVIGLQAAEFAHQSLKRKLNSADEQAQSGVKQAENGLTSAQKNLEQAKVLQEIQLLAANGQLNAARTQYDLAKIRSDNTLIKAPIAGVITQKFAMLGQEAAPGSPLFELQNDRTKKIIVEASAIEAAQIKIGDQVTVDSGDTGVVFAISPALNSISKKSQIEILYLGSSDNLMLGSLVNVQIPVAGANGQSSVIVPLKSVQIGETVSKVKVVVNHKLAERDVTLGKITGEAVEITAGLSRDDLLVIEGAEFLEIGSEVEAAL